MKECRRLTKKKLAVLEDIFKGELEEQQILEKHNITARRFNQWQNDELFIDALNSRLKAAHNQGAFLLTRYTKTAAVKLSELTDSENAETARKTCLDIIELSRKASASGEQKQTEADESPPAAEQLSDATAGKLLAVLAEKKDR